ncbi:non-homologous end-joining DNA ligase [Streptomyces varsoviensis]|uniref:non-homologous end-joining DNA ligase n=1 Tax=Streptomyces varsoviensis TaxID=67373 RepID=UPI00066253E8|nr:non-homologous end-joining DNA ligase [Streptomyces varsoviensis]
MTDKGAASPGAGWRNGLSEDERTALRAAAQPRTVRPMLATLTEDYFSDPDWLFERKLDGERCLGFRKGAEARLTSRSGEDLTDTYPEVADALAAQEREDFVVDGEMVAFSGTRTSFARLQQRMGIHDAARARRSPVAVVYYVFDLLHLDGHDLTALPLRTRKALLREALSFRAPLRFTNHRNAGGEAYLRQACGWGWEGLIAKRADGRYVPRRSRDWLKFKCGQGQELVIGGFTEPAGSRVGFGALLVGYYQGDRLCYAGKVGTGYDRRTLTELRARMDALERERQPFAGGAVRERGAHWVRPELVAEVAFTEWTGDGKLRHPRFLGLRTDKPAEQVVRERPRAAG